MTAEQNAGRARAFVLHILATPIAATGRMRWSECEDRIFAAYQKGGDHAARKAARALAEDLRATLASEKGADPAITDEVLVEWRHALEWFEVDDFVDLFMETVRQRATDPVSHAKWLRLLEKGRNRREGLAP